ncbi:MAG: cell division protein FtsZ, partial [Candidatus Paceibacterota bacterium]
MAKTKKSKIFNLASIKVVGVGGAGGHIITRMAQKEGIKNVEFVAINTDAQDLEYTQARKKIYIGKTLTKGLGAGMNPELGRQAAEENRSEISEALQGADIVFVTAGLGGGTGSLGS